MQKYDKPYPTIKTLIQGKTYDYVSYRGYDEKRDIPAGGWPGEFMGCFEVQNGKIMALDGDTYDDAEPVIYSEEWEKPEHGIISGLTLVVACEFVPAAGLGSYLDAYKKREDAKQ